MTERNTTESLKEFLGTFKRRMPKDVFIDMEAALSDIFPKLKESMDERIRKSLINLFKIENFNGYTTLNGIDVDDVITWLEKQREKKPKWTNEDSSMQLTLMRDIEQISFISKEGKDERIMWLNKLDDRFAHQDINGEQKSEWGDEDEDNLNSAIYYIRCNDMPYSSHDIEPIVEWLRTIKQRMEKQ